MRLARKYRQLRRGLSESRQTSDIVLRNISALLIAALLQASAFAQTDPAPPCREKDRKCAAAAQLRSPVRKLSYWESAFARPVEQRVGAAARELVTYLTLDNIANGYPNRPQPAALPADFLQDVNDAFAGIPLPVRRLLERKLAGIYFLKDLGGTGFTEYVLDAASRPAAGFVVLDQDVLAGQTANAWAAWKENTPFRADARFKLEAQIEETAQDNRGNAIQYILLHELGHVLSTGETMHPRWDRTPRQVASVAAFPFARLGWKDPKGADRYASRFDAAFPLRRQVAYYFGAKLDGDRMVEAYDQLEGTNFPTLYAATNPADDFAESFVSYVHTVLLKRPLEIRLYRDGKLAKTYKSCWEERRCAEKRRILEAFLR